MSFFFLKRDAKAKLGGVYFNAVLGMLIWYLPVYIFALLTSVLAMRQIAPPLVLLVATLSEIFVIDILTVGYLRSMLDLNDKPSGDTKRYDINLVLSGFTNNYKNTLKTMFLRKLYLFGWSCLMLLPFVIAVGVIAFMSYRPEIAELIGRIVQLMQSPTREMEMSVAQYMTDSCAYAAYILLVGISLSLVLAVVYIRKSYLYEMIPFIIAQNPEMPSKDAFSETKSIMHGYRWQYFMLQLSFVWLMLPVTIVALFLQYSFTMYIIMALAMPYINMTFTQFYLARTRVAETENNIGEE